MDNQTVRLSPPGWLAFPGKDHAWATAVITIKKPMKLTTRTFILLLAITQFALGDAPKTEEELIAQFRDAISSKDPAKIDELTYRDGMSEQDKAMSARANKMLIEMAGEIEDVFLKPLPGDFQTVVIMHGKKTEMTAAPKGIVHIKYKSGPTGVPESATPYTIVDNTYFIVGPKSSDLGWQGPPDKNIGFMVVGQGQDNVRIVVEWNASGVPQTKEFSEPSSTFWGQYIESVTVQSDSDDADISITIIEGGETIHQSESLKGKGRLEYKRKG